MSDRPPDFELPEDLLAEIEAARPKQHHNCIVWSPEMDAAIIAARSGVFPVTIANLAEIFRKRGWSHDRGRIGRRITQLKAEGRMP